MKKIKYIFLLPLLVLSGCDGGMRYQFEYYTSSMGQGLGSDKFLCFDDENNSISCRPFNTDTMLKVYQKTNKNDEKFKHLLDDNYFFYNAYFDSNYYYKTDDLLINNIKVINDSFNTGKEVPIIDDLYQIIKFGIDFTKLSKGKFNIAIGTLADIYKDYIAIGQSCDGFLYKSPDKQQIEKELLNVPNYEYIDKLIELNDDKKTIKLNKEVLDSSYKVEGLYKLNLGAIGKGYATMKMEEKLQSIEGYISSGESSVTMLSNSPFQKWNLLLSNPFYREYNNVKNEEYKKFNQFELKLSKDGKFSFSTSGYYENFYYGENKEIIHHIIDGQTGLSTNKFLSVSALCDNSLIADAVTTALMAMDLTEGKSFVKLVEDRYGVNINPIWLERDDDKINCYADSALEEYLYIDQKSCHQKIVTNLTFLNDIH